MLELLFDQTQSCGMISSDTVMIHRISVDEGTYAVFRRLVSVAQRGVVCAIAGHEACHWEVFPAFDAVARFCG